MISLEFALRQTPALHDHPISAVRNYLFNINSQLTSESGNRLLHPQPEDPLRRGVNGPI
jgi:hypothetical protein